MTAPEFDPLDDLFHACALSACMEQAALTGGSPDSEATRRRAFELYEQAVAEKHGVTRS